MTKISIIHTVHHTQINKCRFGGIAVLRKDRPRNSGA